MERPFREALALFTSKFEVVLLLSVTIMLPLLLMHAFLTNYIYAITPTVFGEQIYGDMYYTLLTILFFLFGQVPFIRFTYNEYVGKERSVRDTYFHFFSQGSTFFAFAILLSIVSTVGMVFLYLPGMILLSFFFLVPYIAAIEGKSVWKSWSEGIRLGKRHFWKIFFLTISIGLIELIIGFGLTVFIYSLTSSFAAQLITQILLNMIVFPILVMTIAGFTIKWREENFALETAVTREEWA